MVVTCSIEFDKNPNCVFSSGQFMNGNIILETDKPKNIRGIFVRLSGSAYTHWEEETFDKTDTYEGHEDYFESEVYLLGSKYADKCRLEAGRHQYTFTFQIPEECPTSFESDVGYICYICKVVLVRPWKFNQSFTKAFSVINTLNLNTNSLNLRDALHAKAEKRLWSTCSNNGTFTLHVTLAHSGFVPGEMIPIQLLLTNESNVCVKKITMYLIMCAKYYEDISHVSSNTDTTTISELEGEGVQSYCNKLFKYELPVPSTPPTSVGICSIIDIEYKVQVHVDFKGLHLGQTIDLPVVIGTVPFIKNEEEKNAMSLATDEQCGAASLHCLEKSRDPITYQAAKHLPKRKINAGEKHDYGEDNFTPCYPVFSPAEFQFFETEKEKQ